jgi:hypothetical protein
VSPREFHERWPLLPTLGLFAVAWLALSWPWLSGAVTIPWDAKAHFYPQLQFLAQSLTRAEQPFWTPFVFSGSPQIADPQSLVFSPPYLALALVDPDPGFQAADAVVFGMLGFGGLAIILFFRDRAWPSPSAPPPPGASSTSARSSAWPTCPSRSGCWRGRWSAARRVTVCSPGLLPVSWRSAATRWPISGCGS